jgi:hypothetical protein
LTFVLEAFGLRVFGLRVFGLGLLGLRWLGLAIANEDADNGPVDMPLVTFVMLVADIG